jgi:hypothetical protein
MDSGDEELGEPLASSEATAKAKRVPPPYFSTQRLKQRLITQTYDCIFALAILLLVSAGCGVSFFFCKPCLIGIVILSFCLCPWVPYLNIPLWTAIIMLLHWGYTTVAQKHRLKWEIE